MMECGVLYCDKMIVRVNHPREFGGLRVYTQAEADQYLGGGKRSEAQQVRSEVSRIYQQAYLQSPYWPTYNTKDDIPTNWGNLIARAVVQSPGGVVIVAFDTQGKVMGSLIATDMANVLNSHSKELNSSPIAVLSKLLGEDNLRMSQYVIDTTVDPKIHKSGAGSALIDAHIEVAGKMGRLMITEWTSAVAGNPVRASIWPEHGFDELTDAVRHRAANISRDGLLRGVEFASASKTEPNYAYENNRGAYAVRPLGEQARRLLRVATSSYLGIDVTAGMPID
jgi:hypothetical protein